MFTGLIEGVGVIVSLRTRGNYTVLTVESGLADDGMRVGDSVACDGACLTVVETGRGTFSVEASQETVARTILAHYRSGSRLNLERALRWGDRLGGHFVTGHIDGAGSVESVRRVGESQEIGVNFDSSHDPLVVEKGSIAINGISLTVNAVRSGWFSVNLIPHSLSHTTAGEMAAGQAVNLEFDMIGKYVLKVQQSSVNSSLTSDKLRGSGW